MNKKNLVTKICNVKKMIAMLLVVVIAVAVIPIMATPVSGAEVSLIFAPGDEAGVAFEPVDIMAYGEEESTPATITAFAALPASVANQSVAFGSELAALDLPAVLTATTDAAEDYTVTVPVSWGSTPEFEGFAGEYIFTAAVQGDFDVAEGVNPPIIAVTVEPLGIMPLNIVDAATLQAAIDAAPNNTLTPINITGNIPIDATITIPANKNISFTGGGSLTRVATFSGTLVTINADGSLILESITIDGNRLAVNNSFGLIAVNGNLTMNPGAAVQNNESNTSPGAGRGVTVSNGGVFTMTGGTISGNHSNGSGGGVTVAFGGVFIMSGGTISGNHANGHGGGVDVQSGAFTMTGGEISGNHTNGHGGGVQVLGQGSFIMENGVISGNNADSNGGGVHVGGDSNFTINGGEISGNSAGNQGTAINLLNPETTANLNGGVVAGTVTSSGTITTNGSIFPVMNSTQLTSALTAIGNGTGTIRLGANILNHPDRIHVTGGANITFDLNGFNLTVNNTATGNLGRGMEVFGPGTVVNVTGNGTMSLNATGAGSDGLLVSQGATVNLAAAATLNATSALSNGVITNGLNSAATVTNATGGNSFSGARAISNTNLTVRGDAAASGTDSWGASATDGATIHVLGNATATGTGSIGAVAHTGVLTGGTVNVGGSVSGVGRGAFAMGAGSEVNVTGNATASGNSGQGARAENGGEVNVNGDAEGVATGAFAMGAGSEVNVTGNATATGGAGDGARANLGGEVNVDGNAIHDKRMKSHRKHKTQPLKLPKRG